MVRKVRSPGVRISGFMVPVSASATINWPFSVSVTVYVGMSVSAIVTSLFEQCRGGGSCGLAQVLVCCGV